jgi:RecJ-like exonuclease
MPRATDGCGKTDDLRPMNKRNYDKNYLRLYGIMCEDCKGTGVLPNLPGIRTRYWCDNCDGLGYIPKPKKRFKKEDL